MPILVLNDEGHHCWRPKTGETKVEGESAEEKKAIEEEIDEARVWLAGLDRINNSGLTGKGVPSILATVDLSATPFYLGASGSLEGSPFPWLVSDFGLVDAIESGIVKIPRLPVLDDTKKKDDAGRPEFTRSTSALWKHVADNLKPKDRVGKQRSRRQCTERPRARCSRSPVSGACGQSKSPRPIRRGSRYRRY